MNIILFEAGELARPLPRSDPRAVHILDVLRRRPGDNFDAGVIDGLRGKATLTSVDAGSISLRFVWTDEPPPLYPITLVVGLPRPQTARKILQEAASLGVEAIYFVHSDRGEPSYASSRLWTTGEWRRHLIDGAQQAFSTRLPSVEAGAGLTTVLDKLPAGCCRVALDNYEAARPLSEAPVGSPVALAAGAEPGWSARERVLLRASGFELVHLGPRVLRSETACVAAIVLLQAKLGLI